MQSIDEDLKSLKLMNPLISIELMREIFGPKVKTIYKLESNPNLGKFDLPYSMLGCGEIEWVNIFELKHMLKFWALQQKFQKKWLTPEFDKSWKKFACYVNNHPEKYVYGDTPFECVVKACEWLLKEKQSS